MLKCAEKFVQLIMAAEISLIVEGRGAKQPTASLNIRNPSSGAKSKEHIHLLLINTTPSPDFQSMELGDHFNFSYSFYHHLLDTNLLDV